MFKALADVSRRFLLDLLFDRDGRTLTELESELAMTRFGVMKHLRVLENAGLIVTRWSGREKLHFLNAVPIRLIHDRWIHNTQSDRYPRSRTSKRSWRRRHAPRTKTRVTTQVYEIYIKAEPQAIWDAITKPEWTAEVWLSGPQSLRPSSRRGVSGRATPEMVSMGMPEVAVDGEVIESDPPRKLVQTYRFLFTEAMKSEGFTRVTWEIERRQTGFSVSRSLTSSRGRRRWRRWCPTSSPSLAPAGGAGPERFESLLETGTNLGG